ncbi:hypothetical protein GGX14DRAFT_567155 [Mycena pura]|uniref:Uncharacterized protein n=1 Tax=Mycena pura TaxID=153505 RepID=A0AAD6VBX2_9AGAR|nr:hypothetical protein GGX14DRAFT_567155 [Mycena pura]
MVFESAHGACALKYILSAAGLLTAAKDLFLAILDAFRRRILHRDISVNNILVVNSQLLMVDWEIERFFHLANWDPHPHDDIESAVYVLVKVLTKTFVPVDQQRKWAVTLNRYHWDDPEMDPSTLFDHVPHGWTYDSCPAHPCTPLPPFQPNALVDGAVAAVDSVDASSLIWSGAGVVEAGQVSVLELWGKPRILALWDLVAS